MSLQGFPSPSPRQQGWKGFYEQPHTPTDGTLQNIELNNDGSKCGAKGKMLSVGSEMPPLPTPSLSYSVWEAKNRI